MVSVPDDSNMIANHLWTLPTIKREWLGMATTADKKIDGNNDSMHETWRFEKEKSTNHNSFFLSDDAQNRVSLVVCWGCERSFSVREWLICRTEKTWPSVIQLLPHFSLKNTDDLLGVVAHLPSCIDLENHKMATTNNHENDTGTDERETKIMKGPCWKIGKTLPSQMPWSNRQRCNGFEMQCNEERNPVMFHTCRGYWGTMLNSSRFLWRICQRPCDCTC